jgi:broad specificity phosphatase PhoE
MNHGEILLVRHPEAFKNVEDRHGGRGTALTPKGLKQCAAISKHLRRHCTWLDGVVLTGHHVPHVEQTVERLAGELGIKIIWDDRLRGLDLGVLGGLSRAEAMQQFPDAAMRLELWRKGDLKIQTLAIPNAEPVGEFKLRIQEALLEWLTSDGEELVAICTRSVLIMLTNLISLFPSFDFDRYKVYHFDDASITEVRVDYAVPKLVATNSVIHLDHAIW